jgi:hypothetical protein
MFDIVLDLRNWCATFRLKKLRSEDLWVKTLLCNIDIGWFLREK